MQFLEINKYEYERKNKYEMKNDDEILKKIM